MNGLLIGNVKPAHGFIYSGDNPFSVDAGATGIDSISINDNYDFGWYYWVIVAYVKGTATEIAFPKITLLLQVNNYKYFNNPLNISLLAGDGRESLYQVVPYYAMRNNKLKFTYTNDESTDVDIFTQLVGFETKNAPSYI